TASGTLLPVDHRRRRAFRTDPLHYSSPPSSSPPATPPPAAGRITQDGLAGAEARGDADAAAAGGVGGGGVRGGLRHGGLPAHAARLRRRGRPHRARHRPELALLQPPPAQVARRRRGRPPPAPAGQRHPFHRG
ncbi:hypothetical protein EE612_059347, partial [Oryza sativa]